MVLAVVTALAWSSFATSDTITIKEGSAVKQLWQEYRPIPEHPDEDDINLAVVSSFFKYGLDQKDFGRVSSIIFSLAKCESGLYANAYNPRDTDSLPAYGLMQYKMRTFMVYAKKYSIEYPNIWNPKQQINVAVNMIMEGQAKQWGCYHRH